jgi:centromeric protein E
MVRLWIESSSSSDYSNNDETRISSLSLVDLAGSESVRLNGAERREEGQYINKSLMTLGQVVLSLSDISNDKRATPQHIPYRDSKLTRLLQPSLSGNAQMLLLCCIHPLASHLEESHNTFKFATRAKRIEQKATIHTVQDKDETLLQTYREEIEDLRQQLAEAREQRRLLEEQQQKHHELQEQRQQQEQQNSNATVSDGDFGAMASAAGEIQELVDAIQKMEHLILKSHPKKHQNSTSATDDVELDDTLASILQSDDEDDEDDDDLLVDDLRTLKNKHSTAGPRTPSRSANDNNDDDELHSELARIRGILGSVLQKRTMPEATSVVASPDRQDIRKNLDFSTPPHPSRGSPDRSSSDQLWAGMKIDGVDYLNDEKKAEVETLKKQLAQQERSTNLRKADASFLQNQLEEKDRLLEEVSVLLEAVEQRQIELERENEALKKQVETLTAQGKGPLSSLPSLPPNLDWACNAANALRFADSTESQE